jgi:hypothetical protein
MMVTAYPAAAKSAPALAATGLPGLSANLLPGVYPGHARQRYASELLLTATNMPVIDGFGADKIG